MPRLIVEVMVKEHLKLTELLIELEYTSENPRPLDEVRYEIHNFIQELVEQAYELGLDNMYGKEYKKNTEEGECK